MKAGTERGIRIRIVQSEPTKENPDFDTKELEVKGVFKIYEWQNEYSTLI